MKSINIKFPLEDDKDKNNLFMLNYVTKNALISDLKLLVLTKRGQRYYMPDFGTNLEKYIFQPEDTTTEEEIIADLRKAVRDFMPEIQITKVQFFTNGDESYEELSDNELRILINFTYSDDVFSDAGQIELTF
jgi:phage baseplate assembly protein W